MENKKYIVTPKLKIKLGERIIVDGKKAIKIKHGKNYETITLSDYIELLCETV